MNMNFLKTGALGILVLALVGCDAMFENDVAEKQELGRVNRPIPGPTELPPGLGEDVPATPEPAAIMTTPGQTDTRRTTNEQ